MMKNYTIRAEPTGHVYQALLGLSLQHCETFILVVGSERLLERPGRDVLERLSPLVITRSEEQEWPGTKLIGPTSTVWRFKLSDEAVGVLTSACDGLYDWVEPRLPEDPCLLRADGIPWLVTIAHERDAYMRLSETERAIVRQTLRDLVLSEEPAVPAGQAAKMPVSRYARSTTARP